MLFVAFSVLSVLVVLNLTQMLDSVLSTSTQQSNQTVENLKVWSGKNRENLRKIFTENLETKVTTLLSQDSFVVRTAFVDNAVGDIKELLSKKLGLDKDIVLASFFTVEEDSIKSWQYVSRRYPDGIGYTAKYDTDRKSWVVVQEGQPDLVVLDEAVGRIIEKIISTLS